MALNVFITGNSTGIGAALTEYYAHKGARLFGISRRGYQGPAETVDCRFDLARHDSLPVALDSLLHKAEHLDLVVLNASILGPIGPLGQTALRDAKRVLDVNLWANKIILDWLLSSHLEVGQVVMISSGASTKGNEGWNAYSVSKAALNMLCQLYAHELPDSHLSAVAPGIVDTPMQELLCEQTNELDCPSVNYLRSARGTHAMPTPEQAAPLLAAAFERVRQAPSGGYYDLSELVN